MTGSHASDDWVWSAREESVCITTHKATKNHMSCLPHPRDLTIHIPNVRHFKDQSLRGHLNAKPRVSHRCPSFAGIQDRGDSTYYEANDRAEVS